MHLEGVHLDRADVVQIREDEDIGVLTATRVTPLAACTQRAVEPLLRIPKSAVVTWLPSASKAEALVVANVHAINFDLMLDAYQAQLEAVAAAIAGHHGPVILAGDFNKSLADCAEVIKRNPQHFGALSGYGQIYFQLEEFDKSLDYFRRALAVNPNMGGVEINIRGIEELLREKRKRMI